MGVFFAVDTTLGLLYGHQLATSPGENSLNAAADRKCDGDQSLAIPRSEYAGPKVVNIP